MTTSFTPTVVEGVVIVKDVWVLLPIVALTPPTVTELAFNKLVPVIVVVVPPAVTPEVTFSEVTVGGGLYENTIGEAELTHPPVATK